MNFSLDLWVTLFLSHLNHRRAYIITVIPDIILISDVFSNLFVCDCSAHLYQAR